MGTWPLLFNCNDMIQGSKRKDKEIKRRRLDSSAINLRSALKCKTEMKVIRVFPRDSNGLDPKEHALLSVPHWLGQ